MDSDLILFAPLSLYVSDHCTVSWILTKLLEVIRWCL